MKKQLFKWFVAALFAPILVFFSQNTFGGFILILWPGAIILASLGAEVQPMSQVLYVWFMAIGSNVLIYLFIGFWLHKSKKS